MPKTANSNEMKKMSFEVTKEQYFFLKEKALELQKQNQSASVSAIIRNLIEKERLQVSKRKTSGR